MTLGKAHGTSQKPGAYFDLDVVGREVPTKVRESGSYSACCEIPHAPIPGERRNHFNTGNPRHMDAVACGGVSQREDPGTADFAHVAFDDGTTIKVEDIHSTALLDQRFRNGLA